MEKPVYIVDGCRTPYLKARGQQGPFSASDLAVKAGRVLLSRQPFLPTDIDEVIMGCIMPSEDEANIARLIGLRLGCGDAVPGWTVQRNCASGMQSLDCALKDITLGRADLVLAGGCEAMSRAPLILQPAMADWLGRLNAARTTLAKFKVLGQLRPGYFKPIIALMQGLTDPLCGMIMGKTAEILAHDFGISREEMDAFAVESHQRAIAAQAAGHLDEVIPIFDSKGQCYAQDDGVRADSSMTALAKLRPLFDRKFGMVTAANSSQVTDGAAMMVLASEDAVKKYNLPTLGRIVDVHWAALDPTRMGLGPVFAATPLLQRNQLTLDDIDYWEINEAFAAQVLACIEAWESEDFCQQHFDTAAWGSLDQAKLNIDGGAVALGHPVGSSGARIVLHLLNVLHRTQAKRGVAAICIGGGQGGAMLVERT